MNGSPASAGGTNDLVWLSQRIMHKRRVRGMSRRLVWRWLLFDEELSWMSRRPLWQYLLLDCAIFVFAGLIAAAIAAAILGQFPSFGWFIAWIGTATLVRPALARRRWRRIHAQAPPASVTPRPSDP